MKALLICFEEEKEKASQLETFLVKTGIPSETHLVKSGENGRRNIENTTHIAVLSALGLGWVDFLAGFFCGSRLPILVCGEKAIENIPNVYAFCFKPFNTEKELYAYFTGEHEISKKIEASMETTHARQALLDRGISTTVDALVQCVAEDKVEELALFLAAGFSPDTKDIKGVSLLGISARKGNLKALEFLLSAGAQVNMLSEDRGSTALLDSAMGSHKSLVKALIEAGADTNLQSKSGQTALVVVVGAGNMEIVEMLVKAGADPDIQDALGGSARKYATLFKKTEMLALFDSYASGKEH